VPTERIVSGYTMDADAKRISVSVTTVQFARLADFYHQLGQLTSAGLTIVISLEQLQRHPPGHSYKVPIQQLLRDLASGCTLTDALRQLGDWLPEFDIALLHAGEQSGRLEACLRALADYYTERSHLARQMLSNLAYPVFLLHFAILIFAVVKLFQSGTWVGFLVQTVGVLIPIYAVVALMVYAGQSRHNETWRATLEKLLHPIPVLGTARHYLALSRLAAALEALISAGVTIVEAWELAATACASPALRRAVLAWRPLVNGGHPPSEVISASGTFPSLFAGQYAAGEISGKLDDTLRRLHRYYAEEGTRKLRAVFQWTPRAIYFCVALIIAYKVIHFYTNYFNMVRDAGGF
jgi:type IV pilus assembly protein PilC